MRWYEVSNWCCWHIDQLLSGSNAPNQEGEWKEVVGHGHDSGHLELPPEPDCWKKITAQRLLQQLRTVLVMINVYTSILERRMCTLY